MRPERAAEMIAMLCAKVKRFEPAITQFDSLQRYDVVHAMALVKNLPARMLIRIKYADEVSNIDTLENEFAAAVERGLLRHVEQFAAPERWKIPRKGFLRDMCRLSLVETIIPNVCWNCVGTKGSPDTGGKWTPCGVCGETGFKRPSESKRARIMGVSKSGWVHSWSPRYRVLLDCWDKYEAIGLNGVAKRLSA